MSAAARISVIAVLAHDSRYWDPGRLLHAHMSSTRAGAPLCIFQPFLLTLRFWLRLTCSKSQVVYILAIVSGTLMFGS